MSSNNDANSDVKSDVKSETREHHEKRAFVCTPEPLRAGVHKGFHITFANGFTVSIQWGMYNYCDRVENDEFDGAYNAEVAVRDANNNWQTQRFIPELKNDDVIGRQTAEQVALLLYRMSNVGA